MNKADLVRLVAEKSELTQAQANKAINAVFEVIAGDISSGSSVAISGFGTFTTTARAARTGRNPGTGAAIEIAAKKVPAFKAASALKADVNK